MTVMTITPDKKIKFTGKDIKTKELNPSFSEPITRYETKNVLVLLRENLCIWKDILEMREFRCRTDDFTILNTSDSTIWIKFEEGKYKRLLPKTSWTYIESDLDTEVDFYEFKYSQVVDEEKLTQHTINMLLTGKI